MDDDCKRQVQALIKAGAWSEAHRLLGALDDRNDVDWLMASATVDSELGQPAYALAALKKVLVTRPRDTVALREASLVASECDEHDDAAKFLEELLCIEDENATILNDLAFEYNEIGRHVAAHLAASRAELLAGDEEQRCTARINDAASLANMGRTPDALQRVAELLSQCTGACGQREAAEELQENLRLPRAKRAAADA